jgi:hypothetical protein
MEKLKTFLPLIIGGLVAVLVFIASRSKKKNEEIDRGAILEKAREAKMAKSILRKTEDEESTTNIES